MADYIPDIITLLPQGPPFIMVDRWLGADGTATRTGFVVPAGNPLVENGRFTVAGLIENLAQTAAAGEGFEAGAAGNPRRSGKIVAVDRLEVNRLPETGAELLTETIVTARVGDIIVISGQITCRQEMIALGVLKILAGV
jgi:predicted hotdog family 3-hydroxylacyl-ACP dehydratase